MSHPGPHRKTFREADVRCILHQGPLSGQSGLVHPQLLLTQHLLARAARKFWRRSIFHQSSRSNGSTASDLRLTFRCAVHEVTCRGTKRLFAANSLTAASMTCVQVRINRTPPCPLCELRDCLASAIALLNHTRQLTLEPVVLCLVVHGCATTALRHRPNEE